MLVLLSLVDYEYLLTEEWANSPFWYRLCYLIVTIFLKVYTYFVGFLCMECCFIACGQGYTPEKKLADGTDQPENFNAIRQIEAMAILTQESWLKAVNGWNIQIHNWLKYYVMMRLMDRKKPRG